MIQQFAGLLKTTFPNAIITYDGYQLIMIVSWQDLHDAVFGGLDRFVPWSLNVARTLIVGFQGISISETEFKTEPGFVGIAYRYKKEEDHG